MWEGGVGLGEKTYKMASARKNKINSNGSCANERLSKGGDSWEGVPARGGGS